MRSTDQETKSKKRITFVKWLTSKEDTKKFNFLILNKNYLKLLLSCVSWGSSVFRINFPIWLAEPKRYPRMIQILAKL